jgi:hypothetical protein
MGRSALEEWVMRACEMLEAGAILAGNAVRPFAAGSILFSTCEGCK